MRLSSLLLSAGAWVGATAAARADDAASGSGSGAGAGAGAGCRLRADASVVVYADESGGVGPFSHAWTRAFFAWWAAPAANAGLVADFALAADLNPAYPGACTLAALPALRLYVQPGGAAANQSAALGPGGRDNLLDFAAGGGAYMGTCAGAYYAAGSYWWAEAGEAPRFYPNAWQPHWTPTVEGPIKQIAEYPAYAPTALSSGLTQVYWGGPALGLAATTATIPDGGTVLATFDHAAVPAGIPATWVYRGQYVRALLNSPHPEAQAGVGLACAPPLPAGCITPAQQLANWRDLAANINDLVGWSWEIPTEL